MTPESISSPYKERFAGSQVMITCRQGITRCLVWTVLQFPDNVLLTKTSLVKGFGSPGNSSTTTTISIQKHYSIHSQSNLVSIVGPGAELERAQLFVERIKLDVYRARTLVDGGRLPMNPAAWKQRRFCHQRHLITPVSAAATTPTVSHHDQPKQSPSRAT